jgi:hypothetical protein
MLRCESRSVSERRSEFQLARKDNIEALEDGRGLNLNQKDGRVSATYLEAPAWKSRGVRCFEGGSWFVA